MLTTAIATLAVILGGPAGKCCASKKACPPEKAKLCATKTKSAKATGAKKACCANKKVQAKVAPAKKTRA